MAEVTTNETKITSTITESTNLAGTVYIETNGAKQPIMNVNCSLSQNSVANIQTYVTNMDVFLANTQLVSAEVQKFREKASDVAKGLNCFVF